MFINFTPPVSGAYLSEIVPFYTGTKLNLLLLWNVGDGNANAPVQILQYNANTNSFFDDTANMFVGAVPDLGNPRNVTAVTLNGNGVSFIIAEQGLDASPWPGATDTLLLASANGQLTNASANLPQTLAYTHDVSSGVIDHAGDVGTYLNNIYSAPNTAPYYLISNGNGTFANQSTNFLPTNLHFTYPAYTSSALVDLNGDGLADLVLGAEDLTQGPSLIYLNPGNGNFAGVTPIALPAPLLAATVGLYNSTPTGPTVLDIESIHLSSPNYNDLVVISTNGNYQGYAIQILINDGAGHFTDQTASRLSGAPSFANYSSGQPWVVRSFITDINGDGASDIVTQGNNGAPSEVFLNDGTGNFVLDYSITSASIMAVATIAGVPTLIESNGASVAPPILPLIHVSSQAATRSQVLSLSALVTISDPGNLGYQTLELWDNNGTLASGHFVVNGVAQTGGHQINVSSGNLANTVFDVGTAGGTDTLYARLLENNNTLTSWQSFTVMAPLDQAPVTTPVSSSVTATHGETSVAASSLFSVTDLDGDNITEYALWDTGGSGHWSINGVAQAANTEIDITAAQLAQTTYVFGGAGTPSDLLYEKANDGSLWGNWSAAVTASPFADHAPAVAASNLAAAHGQSLAASSMFTVTDADGDAITEYALWDSNTNGHWVVNGVAQAATTEIDVTAAQLANTVYQSGSGTDQLYARANDGTLWGTWQGFTVTAPINQPPVATAGNAAIAAGHSVAASSLFTAVDPNGDAVTTYAFWDSNTNGHFAVNGTVEAANTEIDVTAAQLAQTTYVAGSGTDQLFVRVNDGTAWSGWQAFTGGPVAPVVAAANEAIAAGHSVAASSLFTASDPDGGMLTTYAFWDSNTNGHFAVNGVTKAANTEIDVTAAQLAQTTYVAGSGTDQLFVRVNDGTAWSGWDAFTAGPVPPTVTASNLTTAPGQSIAASNLFTASDPDGGTLTTYAFWDSNTNGHFAVNGVTKAANTEIDVTAAQLAQTTYVAGSGTDQLFVRVYNGTAWSGWQAFTAGPVPPVVAAPNAAIEAGHSVAASSLFTASDPDGGTLTTYAFWDSNNNGHFSVNGTSQAANTEIDVTAAQLAQTSYVAGSGTDQLFVRVYDGTAWSTWQAFTAGPVPPVATASNLTTAPGQSIAASNLFTASDPDGGTLSTYAFWDSNTNGHFAVNGVAQGANTEIDVTAAQLAQTTYVAGSGTDQLFVRVNDGTAWSSWQGFTATGSTPAIINTGATVELGSAYPSQVTFFGPTGTLKLDNSASFNGTVAGMTAQDTIDFADINFASIQTPTFTNATSLGGTLHVTDGTHTANIALLGNYMASTFAASSDGHGGTLVVDPPAMASQNNLLAQAQHA